MNENSEVVQAWDSKVEAWNSKVENDLKKWIGTIYIYKVHLFFDSLLHKNFTIKCA